MNLKEIPFFKDLDSDDLNKLSSICLFKSYRKGEFLFMEGDEPQWLNIITKGTIKIYKTTPKGKEIFLHTIRPISMVAELVNFENITYPASGVFLSNSEILRIDYFKFKDEFLLNPKICFAMLKSMAEKLRIMNGVIQNELTLKSNAKVAKFIVESSELFHSIKQTQIAYILNMTPETLSRILTQFKQSGLLRIDDSFRVTFKDETKLKEFYNS